MTFEHTRGTRFDDLLASLAHETRRGVVDALDHAGDRGVAVEDLAAGDSSERVALHHVHLPRLQEAGVVEWDRDRDRVTGGPRFDVARRVLDVAGTDGPVGQS